MQDFLSQSGALLLNERGKVSQQRKKIPHSSFNNLLLSWGSNIVFRPGIVNAILQINKIKAGSFILQVSGGVSYEETCVHCNRHRKCTSDVYLLFTGDN
jgi:hypothetical protein